MPLLGTLRKSSYATRRPTSPFWDIFQGGLEAVGVKFLIAFVTYNDPGLVLVLPAHAAAIGHQVQRPI
jgi:hypothetical protein